MTAIHRDDTRRRQQTMDVKVVLTQTEGAPHFALLDDLEIEGLRIVQVSTPEELATEIGDADVLYGFPTADLLRSAKALRWIQSPSAGVNYLQDLPELVESEIVLTNTRGAHGPSIGEHTFALLFALTRHIPESIQAQRDHYWARRELYRTSREMRGSTMGIMGPGGRSSSRAGCPVRRRDVGYGTTPRSAAAVRRCRGRRAAHCGVLSPDRCECTGSYEARCLFDRRLPWRHR